MVIRSDLIELAHVGMHPDRLRQLLAGSSSTGALLRRIRSGGLPLPEAAQRASFVEAAEREAEATAGGYRLVVLGDPEYPCLLAATPEAPFVLFVKGKVPPEPRVAVVGTRRCTSYGREMADEFGAALADAGVVVVSGLAYGIDEATHRATTRQGGVGIAVLGCGIDRWYPQANADLGRRLLDLGGAIISEYPPGVRPSGWRFPPRNRIISGLCAVTVVVEATVKGGALITARYAMEQGRDVFAVPGDIDRRSSDGTNRLIRDGAWPVFGPADLVESVERLVGVLPS